MLLFVLLCVSTSARLLTKEVLLNSDSFPVTSAVDNSEFLPSVDKIPTYPSVSLDGYITITGFDSFFDRTFELIYVDESNATAYPQPFDTLERRTLPNLSFQYVHDRFDLLPVTSGYQPGNRLWEYILLPSRCWHEAADGMYVRCVIVFALTERQQNCAYNGLMTFLVHSGTYSTSSVWYQITNSYCAYYQFNTYGRAMVTFSPSSYPDKQTVIDEHSRWLSDHVTVKSILDLAPEGSGWTLENNPFNYYPDHADCSPINPYKYSLGFYGVITNNTLYQGITATRSGPHPYPKYVVHPSYSLAKSNFISLSVGVLDSRGCVFPKSISSNVYDKCILDLIVSDWIPQADITWSNVTLHDIISMSSNHYNSTVYGKDEGSLRENIEFFYSYSHEQKLNFALTGFNFHPETEHDTPFVYQSTLFYLASVTLDTVTRTVYNMSLIDFYAEYICKPLKLSSMYCKPKVTEGQEYAFGGYGMFMTADDIAKFATFWTYGGSLLKESYYSAVMQHNPLDRGVLTYKSSDTVSTCIPKAWRMIPVPNQRYNLGFWSDDSMGEGYSGVFTNCTNNNLVFQSGYNGIRMMIARKKWTYFQDNDNYDFKVYRAVATLANLLGCPA